MNLFLHVCVCWAPWVDCALHKYTHPLFDHALFHVQYTYIYQRYNAHTFIE